MSAPQPPPTPPAPKTNVPRWSFPFIFLAGGLAVHVVLPWAISLITPRYGWVDGLPGLFNLLALIPVAVGMAGMVWGMVMHYVSAPDKAEWGLAPNYFILRGPYQYSRNPMYASEVLFWLGWAAFYGSVAVLIAALLWWAFFQFYQIPREERALEVQFGDTYRDYARTIPRWLGPPRR